MADKERRDSDSPIDGVIGNPTHTAHDLHNAHTANELAGGGHGEGYGPEASHESPDELAGSGSHDIAAPQTTATDNATAADKDEFAQGEHGFESSEGRSSAQEAAGSGEAHEATIAGAGKDAGSGPMGATPTSDVAGSSAAGGSSAAAGEAASHGAVAAGGGGLAAGMINASNFAAYGVMQGAKYLFGSVGKAGVHIAEASHGKVSPGVAKGGVGALLFSLVLTPAILGSNRSILDESIEDNACNTNVQQAVEASTVGGSGGAAVTDALNDPRAVDNAKKIYSVMKTAGASDINIAGALGNVTHESNLDPTAVETIFDEPFSVGPKKKHAEQVNYDIDQIDSSYGARFPAIKQAGIGLIGFTNSNNVGLINFAKAKGKDWRDPGLQIAYMMSKESSFGSNFEKYNSMSFGSLDESTDWFLRKIEGNPGMALGERQSAAAAWAAKIASDKWTPDTSYANSLLAQAGAGTSIAGQEGVSAALANCKSAQGTNGNNSTLAQAAISYAWPFHQQSIDDIAKGQNNRGTPLYQNVHYAVWGSNNYSTNPLSSCDNGLTTAVQWSGADEHIPEQGSDALRNYLMTGGTASGTWKEVPWNDDKSSLQPGDLISKYGHILMYVGNDELLKFYNGDASKFEENGDMVEASYMGRPTATTTLPHDRSPGIGRVQVGAKSNYSAAAGYKVFRLQKPTGSKFQSFKPSSTVVDLKPMS